MGSFENQKAVFIEAFNVYTNAINEYKKELEKRR